jgi:hypothetical protein
LVALLDWGIFTIISGVSFVGFKLKFQVDHDFISVDYIDRALNQRKQLFFDRKPFPDEENLS